MPSKKFADGAEIYEHCRRIGKHFGLYDGAIFSTQVRTLRWDETIKRWRISTNRGDDIRARFVVMAQGPFNRPKLPGIPGIKRLQGAHASTPPLGLRVHRRRRQRRAGQAGRQARRARRHRRDRRSRSSRTWAGTPSTSTCSSARRRRVDARNNTADRSRMGEVAEARLAEGAPAQLPHAGRSRAWRFGRAGPGLRLLDRARPQHCRADRSRRGPGGADARAVHGDAGRGGLQGHGAAAAPRRRASSRTRGTAEALKPYYRFLCKRPCSNDDYLPTFNRPNVTLVDVSATKGVERITEKGIVANGVEYEVDCIIFASGFEIIDRDQPPLCDRRRSRVATACRCSTTGSDGYKTLHGMTSRGFPNQFFTGFIQGGVSANIAAMFEQQAKHIAYIIAEALSTGRDDRRAQPGGAGRAGCKTDPRNRDRQLGVRRRMHARLLQQRRRGGGERESGRSSVSPTVRASTPSRPAGGCGATRVTWKAWCSALERMRALHCDSTIASPSSPAPAAGWAARTRCCSPLAGRKVVVNDVGGSLDRRRRSTTGPAEQVVARDHRCRRRSRRMHRLGRHPPRAARRSSTRRSTTTAASTS